MFLNDFFFEKKSVDFWLWKLNLKVQFWHFLMNRKSSMDFMKKFPSSMLILGQKSCSLAPTIFWIPQPNSCYWTYRPDDHLRMLKQSQVIIEPFRNAIILVKNRSMKRLTIQYLESLFSFLLFFDLRLFLCFLWPGDYEMWFVSHNPIWHPLDYVVIELPS